MPENKITVTVTSWATIANLTIESADPEYILSSIEKLKKALPKLGPPTQKNQA